MFDMIEELRNRLSKAGLLMDVIYHQLNLHIYPLLCVALRKERQRLIIHTLVSFHVVHVCLLVLVESPVEKRCQTDTLIRQFVLAFEQGYHIDAPPYILQRQVFPLGMRPLKLIDQLPSDPEHLQLRVLVFHQLTDAQNLPQQRWYRPHVDTKKYRLEKSVHLLIKVWQFPHVMEAIVEVLLALSREILPANQ